MTTFPMRRFISLFAVLSFFSLLPSVAQMRDVIVNMPDTVLPLLTKVNREDCVDFREANMEAKVSNRFGHTAELAVLTEDYALWKCTESSETEMKLFPLADSMYVVCFVDRVLLPKVDASIRFYDTQWQRLPLKDCISIPALNDASASLNTLNLLLSESSMTMTAVREKESLASTEEETPIAVASDTLMYDWRSGSFALREVEP